MIYQHRDQRLKLVQLLEVLFFAAIVGAFILLIPMKARAEEGQGQNRRRSGASSMEYNHFQTGEQSEVGEDLDSGKLRQRMDWSEALTSEVDQVQVEEN